MKRCRKCRYSEFIGGYDICKYLLMTGEKRECSADDCIRFEDKNKRGLIEMQKLTAAQKREIITLSRNGTKATEIAAKFGIDVSTAYKVIRKYKAWKEIGANSFAETEKEPIAAATATSSEVDTVPTVSDDIIPPVPENVKAEIPEAAAEACIEYIGSLMGCLNTAVDEKCGGWTDDVIGYCDKIRSLAVFLRETGVRG